mmetsp:Transcript_42899/g.100685  ORF Transcript_42899/g.100685 Transcript_42899/m.100685 type:complete len:242 (-) Transcript_42899:224-949(-)
MEWTSMRTLLSSERFGSNASSNTRKTCAGMSSASCRTEATAWESKPTALCLSPLRATFRLSITSSRVRAAGSPHSKIKTNAFTSTSLCKRASRSEASPAPTWLNKDSCSRNRLTLASSCSACSGGSGANTRKASDKHLAVRRRTSGALTSESPGDANSCTLLSKPSSASPCRVELNTSSNSLSCATDSARGAGMLGPCRPPEATSSRGAFFAAASAFGALFLRPLLRLGTVLSVKGSAASA